VRCSGESPACKACRVHAKYTSMVGEAVVAGCRYASPLPRRRKAKCATGCVRAADSEDRPPASLPTSSIDSSLGRCTALPNLVAATWDQNLNSTSALILPLDRTTTSSVDTHAKLSLPAWISRPAQVEPSVPTNVALEPPAKVVLPTDATDSVVDPIWCSLGVSLPNTWWEAGWYRSWQTDLDSLVSWPLESVACGDELLWGMDV